MSLAAGEEGEKGEKGGDDKMGLTVDVRGVGEEGLGRVCGGGVTEATLGETCPECNGEDAGERR